MIYFNDFIILFEIGKCSRSCIGSPVYITKTGRVSLRKLGPYIGRILQYTKKEKEKFCNSESK